MQFDESFVKRALPDVAFLYTTFPPFLAFSVDSRTIQEGEIFVAIQGEQCDGHSFIEQALDRGAAGVLAALHKLEYVKKIFQSRGENKLAFFTYDPQDGLVQLARAWRRQFSYPVVGITGSIGKTSTKEILGGIMRAHGRNCLISHGNQNTLIGLSLNMLRMRVEHDVALFEVGISKRGEMRILAELLQPTTGVITCVGHSHMEGLGSLADIALEKRSLFSFFEEKSIGIVNGDQAVLADVAYAHPVIKFGTKTTNQIQVRKILIGDGRSKFTLKMYGERHQVTLNSAHMGAINNVLAASAVAHFLGVPGQVIAQAVEQPVLVPARFERKALKEYPGILIDDSCNASPESMKAALLALQEIDTKAQKIAVLGDMLELGVNSAFWHRQLGRFLRKVPSLRHVILVGDMVRWTKSTMPIGLSVEHVADWQEAVEALKKCLAHDSVVLVKGSMRTGLKNVAQRLT